MQPCVASRKGVHGVGPLRNIFCACGLGMSMNDALRRGEPLSVGMIMPDTGKQLAMFAMVIFSVAFAAGCHSLPIDVELSGVPSEPASFVIPEHLLHGFDAPGDNAIRDGDQILFGLRLRDDGKDKTWFMSLKVLADIAVRKGWALTRTHTWESDDRKFHFPTWSIPIALAIHDERGIKLNSTQILIPGGFLENGFLEACRASRVLAEEEENSIETMLQGLVTMRTLLKLIQDEPTLEDILWEVIDAPSILGIMMNFGVEAGVFCQFHRSEPRRIAIAGEAQAAERFPFTMTINGDSVFEAELTAVAPKSPMALSGGVWQILGHRPSNPKQTLEIRLLAAKRRGNSSRTEGSVELVPLETYVLGDTAEEEPKLSTMGFVFVPGGGFFHLSEVPMNGKAVMLTSGGKFRYAPGATILEVQK